MNCCKIVRSLTVAALFVTSVNAQERITEDGRLKRDPVFVNQGKDVVYAVDESRVLIRLMRMNLQSKKASVLHKNANKNQYEASFSRDDRIKAYSHNKGNLEMQLFIEDTKTNKRVIIGHKGRGGYCHPCVTPDGKHVLYCFAESGPQHIFRVDAQGKNKTQLTQGVGINNWPSITADGKVIAFASSREKTYELYTMKADGSDVKRVTRNRRMEIRPQISPDGKRIGFVRLGA